MRFQDCFTVLKPLYMSSVFPLTRRYYFFSLYASVMLLITACGGGSGGDNRLLATGIDCDSAMDGIVLSGNVSYTDYMLKPVGRIYYAFIYDNGPVCCFCFG